MRVLLAPDKFKGTLTAVEAAASMARGARALHGRVESIEFPMADGGDGTIDVVRRHLEMVEQTRTVRGPLEAPIEASFVTAGRDAWIEMAACSGLTLCPELRPLDAHSLGTGEMTREATALPYVQRAIVGVGGSASTDGGTGAARALGWKFLDRRGRELPLGGGALVDLERVEPGNSPTIEVVGACDVDSPLLGDRGAARAFAPQKGATPEEVARLEDGLARMAEVVQRDLGLAVSEARHSGAGGGTGAGLLAFFAAGLRSGFDLIADAVGFEAALSGCDVVVTGEGAYDEQTSSGKVVHRVAEAASALGIPCFLVAGDVRNQAEDFELVVDLSERYGPDRARYEAASAVAKATMEALSELA